MNARNFTFIDSQKIAEALYDVNYFVRRASFSSKQDSVQRLSRKFAVGDEKSREMVLNGIALIRFETENHQCLVTTPTG